MLADLAKIFSGEIARKLIGFVKINDAAHAAPLNGAALLKEMRKAIKLSGSDAGIFLDLKLADTSDSNVNTVSHYLGDPGNLDAEDVFVAPDILTIRDSVSATGWLALRQALPNTKLALVSALTDMPEDECRIRSGKSPLYKILVDIDNIRKVYAARRSEIDNNPEPFDMVVCSPLEVRELFRAWGHKYQFIVPGIRDAWMAAGQQARFTGIREALNLGATYVVAGAQLTKGNPKAEPSVSADESRRRTFERVAGSNHVVIIPNNYLATLESCDGFYESPRDASGNYKLLAAYAGTYESSDGSKKNFVGPWYFNLAKAEERPLVREVFCRSLAEKMSGIVPDVLMGMPMGGLYFTATLGLFLGSRTIFAEKKVTALANPSAGTKEKSILILGRHIVRVGEVVYIMEDLCNNFATTQKAVELIEKNDGIFGGILCFINRSEKTEWGGKPVISLVHKPSPEYKQDDPVVSASVVAGKVSWDPKKEWPRLKQIMAEG